MTPRAEADCIVTEHGIAELKGRTLAERARALIEITDPAFRALHTEWEHDAADRIHRAIVRGTEGEQVVVAGADPLNMTGSIIGGARVPTRRNQRVIYRDGIVVDQLEAG